MTKRAYRVGDEFVACMREIYTYNLWGEEVDAEEQQWCNNAYGGQTIAQELLTLVMFALAVVEADERL